MSENPRRRRADDGPVPVLALDLTTAPGHPDLSADETAEAHDRRWAYLKEHGWTLTEEGLVLDTSDGRWAKSDRILVEYIEDLPFSEGVRAAYRRQKQLEAEKLATEQRAPRKR